MTPQEQDMIGGLIDRVQKTQLTEKDTDAEQMLQQGLGRNPNALYILAQTVLVQNYALEQAQKQLADLKAQVEQMQQPEPKHSTSFLGNLLGRKDEPTPPPPPPPQQSYAPAQAYPPPPAYPPYAPVGGGYVAMPPQYGPPPTMGGGGGFLRGAAQTAAGVAAGALAFEGIESLMHGFGNAVTGREFGSVGEGGERPVQEVVNNYYDDSKGDQGVSADERSIGDNVDRDFSGNTNDPYASEDSNDMYAAEDDANYDDDGSDFSDNSGGDDNSF